MEGWREYTYLFPSTEVTITITSAMINHMLTFGSHIITRHAELFFPLVIEEKEKVSVYASDDRSYSSNRQRKRGGKGQIDSDRHTQVCNQAVAPEPSISHEQDVHPSLTWCLSSYFFPLLVAQHGPMVDVSFFFKF